MAAGELDVSWRRNLILRNFSKKECCRNGGFGLESSRIHGGSVGRKNGNCFRAGSLNEGCRRSDGFEIAKFGEDGIRFPPQKKRKFSPIVWDREEKGVGFDSKNEMVASKASVIQPVSLNTGQGMEVLSAQSVVADKGQMRDISVSRCASDSNSSDMSSLESGEFRRESSEEENRPRPSESQEKGSGVECPNDEVIKNKSMDVESESIDQLENSSNHADSFKIEDPGSINMLQGCRSVCEYEKVDKINAGTYGIVYKAKDKKTGQHVALKKVKMERETEGFPMTALREVNILFSLHHPSIVNIKEVVTDDANDVYMAMEYMDYDLQRFTNTVKYPFSISEVKYMMLQLLEGVCYLHENWVIHRDLKTSNILLNDDGKLKICDFGLSRQYTDPLKPYTSTVVTLWYRAPELLLGSRHYSTAIDMWSVGCIMAELLMKEPLFQGRTEIDQLDKIFSILGTPKEMIWPGFSKLRGARAKFVQQPFNVLRKKFNGIRFGGPPALSDSGFDLLKNLLTYDPKKRISAKAALDHDWFREFPPPSYDFKPALHIQLSQQKSYL
ncbi:cyclin-dependent kinase G-2 [Ricinus communis]|uniref:cyclin-dependent kinase n=1 Tax=Ricinus communis TaxID=3988 RepID=B9SAD2_RICCO|nr:cyclin-dependent kinase G-2 [Ricinus communis]EEF39381.1 cdk10/11, putative [Ricinus communis]|eukprot:XP_002522951.1 cyclin-dependent kinase G-2 [Ricinus communis]